MSHSKSYVFIALLLMIAHESYPIWPFSSPTQNEIDSEYQEKTASNKAARKSQKVHADAEYAEEKTTAQASRKKQQNKLDAQKKKQSENKKAHKKAKRSEQLQADSDKTDEFTIIL